MGKPEPLRDELAGWWSRRIDQEHRLICQVQTDKIRILACRYHYWIGGPIHCRQSAIPETWPALVQSRDALARGTLPRCWLGV